MKVCVLSSGSKGNMTYIESGNTRLLIDAGISLSNAKNRRDGLNLDSITDIIVTHEHTDHIDFLYSIYKKTKANIYMSSKSFEKMKPNQKDKLLGAKIGFIESEAKYTIGDVKVLTFKLNHDCGEVFGYIVCGEGKKVGYFTDTGIMPEKYIKFLKDLDVLIIEANHNVQMLLSSQRDYSLINRILSSEGHLSNQRCYEILRDILTEKSKYVILAHISEDCNNEQCLYEEIVNKLKVIDNYKGEIIIGSQYEATKVIEL